MPTIPTGASTEMRLMLVAEVTDSYPTSEEQKSFVPRSSFFLKVKLSAALELDADAFENKDMPLLQVTLEFAYPDSTGLQIWRNTGAYRLNDQVVKEAVPMIWDRVTLPRSYLAAFTYHAGQDQVQVRCKIRYKNPDVADQTQLFTMDLAKDKETKKTFGLGGSRY